MHKRTILFFLFIFFGSVSFSQTNNLLLKNDHVLFFSSSEMNSIDRFYLKLIADFQYQNHFTSAIFPEVKRVYDPLNLNEPVCFRPDPVRNYTYQIPRGAIFCRMENNLRNTFNIWIKIRAGTDESYNEIKPQ